MVYHFGSKDFQASLCFVASKKKTDQLAFPPLKKKPRLPSYFQDQLAFPPLKKKQTSSNSDILHFTCLGIHSGLMVVHFLLGHHPEP